MQGDDLFIHWQTLVGTNLGTTQWLNVDQDRINAFADTTLDHQAIHVDPQAAATQALGGTIAHGFLSLSLLSHMCGTLMKPHVGDRTVLNYGLNKVRFLSPVPSGSDIRVQLQVIAAEEKPQGVLVTWRSEVEIRNIEKPAFVAEQLALLLY